MLKFPALWTKWSLKYSTWHAYKWKSSAFCVVKQMCFVASRSAWKQNNCCWPFLISRVVVTMKLMLCIFVHDHNLTHLFSHTLKGINLLVRFAFFMCKLIQKLIPFWPPCLGGYVFNYQFVHKYWIRVSIYRFWVFSAI